MNFTSFVSSLKDRYDKLLAGGLLAVLLACLLCLGVRMGTMRRSQDDFNRQIERMTPAHPQASKVDTNAYSAAKERFEAPLQIGGWTNLTMFVPETRVWCVDPRCQRPIPMKAKECPFCKAKQPHDGPDESPDADRDGMLDEWEVKYGLNPHDPMDAMLDADNDGFLNIEEFRYGTSPKDAADRPPVTAWLRVKTIKPLPFNLLFKSVSTLPDGAKKFGINPSDKAQTYFVRLGEQVEGFVVEKFETNVVEVIRGNMRLREDKSVLYLRRGEKTIALTLNEVRPYVEYTAVLFSRVDNTELTVKPDSVFEIKGEKFKVISIDSGKSTVVIERAINGKRLELGQLSQSEKKDLPDEANKETP